MAEVERIVAKLRSGDMSIDELTAAVRRATELIGECRKHLTTTEAEVERLINPEA
jgi:exodeoxyribonuclease VII small subunit